MNILETASNSMVKAMKTRLKDMDNDKCEVVNYGLYILLSDLVKNAILLFLSYLLGIFIFCIVAMAGVAVLRSFLGGVHSKTCLGCLIANTSLVFGNVYLSLFLSNTTPIYLNTLIYTICFVIVLLYAPADHENKPIESNKQKRLLKFLSCGLLLLHYFVSVFLLTQPFSSILAISALISSGSTLPLVYKLTSNKHGDAYYIGLNK